MATIPDAYVDGDGICRCGYGNPAGREHCSTRFGIVETRTLRARDPITRRLLKIDIGWVTCEPPEYPGLVLVLNAYNLGRWEHARQRGQLASWKAKGHARNRADDIPTERAVDLDKVGWAVCPKHGIQRLNRFTLRVTAYHIAGKPFA